MFRSPRSLGLVSVLLIHGCASPVQPVPSSNVTPQAQHLLADLKGCLAAIPSKSDVGFTSPCARSDLRILRGISLARLKADLGEPVISSGDYVYVPNNKSAPLPPYECRWAFYTLPANVIAGGGPELQCVSANRVTCTELRWVVTE